MNRNGKNGNVRTGKNNGRRGNNKSKCERENRFTGEGRDTQRYTEMGNNPKWYSTDESLLRDSANIAFNYPNGRPLDLALEALPGFRYATPGLITIEVLPSVGYSNDPQSPINVAAMSMYTFVRKNKAGNLPFDAPDLMCYALAMADIYSYINFLQRLYGMASLYSQQNQYVPRALVSANGADLDDLVSNLANFRYGINVLINKAASLAAPANLTIFQRRAFMYQNIYTEGTTIKDQLYMYVPRAFMAYNDGTDTNSGTRLTAKLFDPGTTHLYKDLLAFGEQMIAALINGTDAQTMSAFILEAYGTEGILKLQTLPENYPIVPVYDLGVLEQMANTTVMPADSFNGGTVGSIARVFQDATKGYLLSWPKVNIDANTKSMAEIQLKGMVGHRILTTDSYTTDASLVMESTRMMVGVNEVKVTGNIAEGKLSCGSEVASGAKVWWYDSAMNLRNLSYGYISVQDPSTLADAMRIPRMLSAFKYHPAVLMFQQESSDLEKLVNIYPIASIGNFTIITNTDLDRLHEAALLNEFNVPKVGKLN